MHFTYCPISHFVLRSSIKSSLRKQTLTKGCLFGIFGGIVLLLSGSFVPLHPLEIWGFPLFLLSLGFITLGFLPYRLLSYLELHPHQLKVTEDKLYFSFSRYALLRWCLWKKPLAFTPKMIPSLPKGRDFFPNTTLSIPLATVQKIFFLEETQIYGIGINFKSVIKEKIIVHQPLFKIENYIQYSQKKFGCDLFLPFFTQRSFKELNDYLEETLFKVHVEQDRGV